MEISNKDIRNAKNILSQLSFEDVHNEYVCYTNIKRAGILIDKLDDELRYKSLDLAETDPKERVIKDDKGNLIFNKKSTTIIEEFKDFKDKEVSEIDFIKFRNNDEIKKLPIYVKVLIDFILPEILEPTK